MKRTLIALAFGFLLAGCATEAKYGELLDTWMGASESQLISQWGAPASVYESGGAKYLTYRNASSGYVPGTPASYQSTVVGNTVYTNRIGGSPGFMVSRWCDTTFTVRDSLVVHWSWQGNGCRAM